MANQINPRPWSARRPQSLVLSAVMLVILVALVATALRYIAEGVGGLVPYFMVVFGPIICGYYLWYWNLYRFDEAGAAPGAGAESEGP